MSLKDKIISYFLNQLQSKLMKNELMILATEYTNNNIQNNHWLAN